MKYLVYLLLGLNVLYFAWIQTQPAPVPPPLQVKPLPSGVESLVLLSERSRAARFAGTPATATGEAEAVDQAPVPESVTPSSAAREGLPASRIKPVCRTLGPLTTAEVAIRLRDRLSVQDFAATLREGEIEIPSSYQVYLPATTSGKAREVVSTLEAAGMTDYFVGRRNRISLGIFSSKSKALVRREAIRKLGYDAMLNTRYKTSKVYWIDTEEKTDHPPESPVDWQQLTSDYPEVKVQQVSCE